MSWRTYRILRVCLGVGYVLFLMSLFNLIRVLS